MGRMRTVEIGDELEPLVKDVVQEDMDLFESFALLDHPNIHTDPKAAQDAGVGRDPIASGRMTTAYASEAAARFFGEKWTGTGKTDLNFIRPVKHGDILTVRGVVKEKTVEVGGTRVVLDIWVENQRGDKTAVGSASGTL